MDVEKVQFEILMETAVDGIIVTNSSGLVEAFNPACERLFGYDSTEVLGMNVKMLMPMPYRDQHDQYMADYQASGVKKIIGYGREVTGRRKDGSTFPMYLSVGEGLLKGKSIFVGIIHDLSERYTAERQLKSIRSELLHVSRLSDMGQLASALAHELNQPLTAVVNYVKAASRTLGSAQHDFSPSVPRAQGLMDKAKEQTLRAGQIVKRLRDFIQKGESQRTAENMSEVVEGVLELALVGAAEAEIAVYTDLQAGLPYVSIDKVQIQQVVLNLVRNGVEALQGESQRHLYIATSLDSRSQTVVTSITDSGPGVSSEVLEKLFQPFVTTKQNGLGIGLSICKTIVDAHGGHISADNISEGGAIFRFSLPIITADGTEDNSG